MLDASRERGVEVEVVGVVTSGGEDLVDSAEDSGHPLGVGGGAALKGISHSSKASSVTSRWR